MSETLPRPRQVTFSAGLIIIGSVFVVISVFELVAGLSSLNTRETVEEFLAEPPGKGLGLSTREVLEAMHWLAMLAGACATAAAILGAQVLRRSNGARVALSVVAVPLFATGLVVGGLISSVVAAAVVTLWLQPARDWFAGRQPVTPPREPEQVRAAQRRDAAPHPELPPQGQAPAPWQPGPQQPGAQQPGAQQPGAQQPGARPYTGFGSPEATHAPRPAPAWPAEQAAPPGPPAPARRAARRPTAVLWACVLTWTFAAAVGGLMLISAVVLAAAPDAVFDELERQDPDLIAATGMSQDDLVRAVVVAAVVLVAWCVVACVLAALAFRGTERGRIALLVCAALAALGTMAGTVTGSIFLVVPFAACVTVVGLLSRREVRAWTARRGSMNP